MAGVCRGAGAGVGLGVGFVAAAEELLVAAAALVLRVCGGGIGGPCWTCSKGVALRVPPVAVTAGT